MSVDAKSPEEVVAMVVADAVVASLYPVVDVVKVPYPVESSAKKNKCYLGTWHAGSFI